MYFEPLISVKCCPKLHIKQLRNNLYLHLSVRSGWVGIGVTDEKGGSRKRGGQAPLTPPPLDTPMSKIIIYLMYLYSVNQGQFILI